MSKRDVFTVLFVLLITFSAFNVVILKTSENVDAATYYVGGSGGGNYTSIQNAVDDSSSGDTVFVYEGFYNETIRINKSLELKGESRKNTIINGTVNESVIQVRADGVNITQFTIQNGSIGIDVQGDNCWVRDNTIKDLYGVDKDNYNEKGGSGIGIRLIDSNLTDIHNNSISSSIAGDGGDPGGEGGLASGIYISDGDNISITENDITNIVSGNGGDKVSGGGSGGHGGIGCGIYVKDASDTYISKNNISKVYGGNGGNGGDYYIAGDGGPSYGIYMKRNKRAHIGLNNISSISGGDGGNGEYAPGGSGGNGSALHLERTNSSHVTSNIFYSIKGGSGGDGEEFGPGGRGGKGIGLCFNGSFRNDIENNTMEKIRGGSGGYSSSMDYVEGSEAMGIGVFLIDSTHNRFFENRLYNIQGSYPQKGFGFYFHLNSMDNEVSLNNTYGDEPVVYKYNDSDVEIKNLDLTSNVNPTNLGKVVFIESNNISVKGLKISQYQGEKGMNIQNKMGEKGGQAAGVYIESCDGFMMKNTSVSYILGGTGGDGGNKGGTGGRSSGLISIDSKNVSFEQNRVYNITGGKGGWGYDSHGGKGGTGAGVVFLKTNISSIEENTLFNISGGLGGKATYESAERGDGGLGSGVYLEDCSKDNIIDNHVNSIKGGDGAVYFGPAGDGGNGSALYLNHSDDLLVYNNTFEMISGGDGGDESSYEGGDGGNGSCLMLLYSSNNTIRKNQLENSSYGEGGTGSPPGVNGTAYGSYLGSDSPGNLFYHNNILYNQVQAYDEGANDWDNGYPSGGNYWSDYNGSDEYQGANQNQSGSDGIGDSPYEIDGSDNKDNYPLMEPYKRTPSIMYTVPEDKGNDVPVSQEVKVVFAGSMNTSVEPVINQTSGQSVNYTFSGWSSEVSSNDTAVWTHENWSNDENITLNVSGYEDLYGNQGENYSWSFQTNDTIPPTSNIDIEGYWIENFTKVLSATAYDWNSGVRNVTLYYRYSPDNSTWTDWKRYGTDPESPYDWNFKYSNGRGHYQFYTKAVDNSLNVEGGNDTESMCGYEGMVKHPPIRIDNNSELESMAKGNGTKNDPYILEGYSINGDGYGYCIYMGNISKYFVLKDSHLYNASGNSQQYRQNTGLYLYNVTDGHINKNTINNSWDVGIRIISSDEVELMNNTIDSEYYGYNGVLMDGCINNTVEDNVLKNHLSNGIKLVASDETEIKNNTARKNDGNGMLLSGSDDNIILNNDIDQNQVNGIILESSNFNSIFGNRIENNNRHSMGGAGVFIRSNAENNTLLNNHISTGGDYGDGISIKASDNNSILDNKIEDNLRGNGIQIETSGDTHVEGNELIDNACSLYLDGASNNTAADNIIEGYGSSYGYGVWLKGSDYNKIVKNDIDYYMDYGFYLNSTSKDNHIYHNNIANFSSSISAHDEGSNHWSYGYPSGGNYWEAYTGEDNYSGPNQDQSGSDGIGDSEFSVEGGTNADSYPLMEPWGSEAYVLETEPGENSTDVDVSKEVTVVFSQSMNTSVGLKGNMSYSFLGWSSTYRANDTARWSHPDWQTDTFIELTVYNLSRENYSWNFKTEDTVPPGSSVDNISRYWMGDSNINITATASDSSSGVENVSLYYRYSLDNESWGSWNRYKVDEAAPWGWSFDYPEGEGYYRFYSIASDSANNTEAKDSFEAECGHDTSAPSVHLNSPTEDEKLNYSSVFVNWTAYDSLSGIDHYELRSEGGGWESIGGNSSYEVDSLSDGDHTVDLKAVDHVGNSVTITVNFTVDTRSPMLSIAHPSDGDMISSSSIEIVWSGEDPTSGISFYEVKTNGEDWSGVGMDKNHTFSNLSDGYHTLSVKAVDDAGNEKVMSVNITVDTKSPEADAGGNRTVGYGTEIVFDGSNSSDDAGIVNYSWSIEGEIYHGRIVSYNFSSAGEYEVKLTVKDEAGNSDTDKVNYTVIEGSEESDSGGLEDDKKGTGFALVLIPALILLSAAGYLFLQVKKEKAVDQKTNR